MSEHKCFLVYVNDLKTTVALYKYVDDSTLFEISDRKDVYKKTIINVAQYSNFRSTIPNIKINGRDIAHVCLAKLLDETISHDLSWNKHVENL